MNQYNDVVVTGKIDYSAFVYTGHYKLELPSGSIIDDTVLNSSFNVSDTSFVYTSKSILGNQPSWVFYKSFTRVGSCTKTVKVSCVATTKGTKSVYCGTGNKGDHDLDAKHSRALTVK